MSTGPLPSRSAFGEATHVAAARSHARAGTSSGRQCANRRARRAPHVGDRAARPPAGLDPAPAPRAAFADKLGAWRACVEPPPAVPSPLPAAACSTPIGAGRARPPRLDGRGPRATSVRAWMALPHGISSSSPVSTSSTRPGGVIASRAALAGLIAGRRAPSESAARRVLAGRASRDWALPRRKPHIGSGPSSGSDPANALVEPSGRTTADRLSVGHRHDQVGVGRDVIEHRLGGHRAGHPQSVRERPAPAAISS